MLKRYRTNEEMIRYVYMIEVDNHGERSKFYGKQKLLYTGSTNNITRRTMEHVKGVNSNFMNRFMPHASKKLVFVHQIFGNEYDVLQEEWNLKKKSSQQKHDLIESEENDLVRYIPFKAIILKKLNNKEEQVVLYFNKKIELS